MSLALKQEAQGEKNERVKSVYELHVVKRGEKKYIHGHYTTPCMFSVTINFILQTIIY